MKAQQGTGGGVGAVLVPTVIPSDLRREATEVAPTRNAPVHGHTNCFVHAHRTLGGTPLSCFKDKQQYYCGGGNVQTNHFRTHLLHTICMAFFRFCVHMESEAPCPPSPCPCHCLRGFASTVPMQKPPGSNILFCFRRICTEFVAPEGAAAEFPPHISSPPPPPLCSDEMIHKTAPFVSCNFTFAISNFGAFKTPFSDRSWCF